MGTRDAVRGLVSERLYPTRLKRSGTSTGGSTSSVVDTALISTLLTDNNYVGAIVYIDDSTDDAAPEGEEARITAFGETTGTLTTSPAWTATTATGDTYEIHYGFSVLQQINPAINKSLNVGTRYVESFMDDVTAQTALRDDIVAEGALALLKYAEAEMASGPLRDQKLGEARAHEVAWQRGAKLSGYGWIWLFTPPDEASQEPQSGHELTGMLR